MAIVILALALHARVGDLSELGVQLTSVIEAGQGVLLAVKQDTDEVLIDPDHPFDHLQVRFRPLLFGQDQQVMAALFVFLERGELVGEPALDNRIGRYLIRQATALLDQPLRQMRQVTMEQGEA